MKDYLKKFVAIANYNIWKNSEDYIEPSVSYIIEDNDVLYNYSGKLDLSKISDDNYNIYLNSRLSHSDDIANMLNDFEGILTTSSFTNNQLIDESSEETNVMTSNMILSEIILRSVETNNDGETYYNDGSILDFIMIDSSHTYYQKSELSWSDYILTNIDRDNNTTYYQRYFK